MKRIFAVTAPKEEPFRPFFVSDAAQRLVALAVDPRRRGMKRAPGHGPGEPAILDHHRPIAEPGGDKLPRKLVGGAVPRARSVSPLVDHHLGDLGASGVRCSRRLVGPARHRDCRHPILADQSDQAPARFSISARRSSTAPIGDAALTAGPSIVCGMRATLFANAAAEMLCCRPHPLHFHPRLAQQPQPRSNKRSRYIPARPFAARR
jgi:hypothetical protein